MRLALEKEKSGREQITMVHSKRNYIQDKNTDDVTPPQEKFIYFEYIGNVGMNQRGRE